MTTSNPPLCGIDRRRQIAREHGFTGIESVEVEPGRKFLRIYFIGETPPAPPAAQIEIKDAAGRPAAVVHVERRSQRAADSDTPAEPPPSEADREMDNYLRVELARPCGPLPHTLRLHGIADLDPRLDECTFEPEFDLPRALDCGPRASPTPRPQDEVAITYLAKDYAGFRQLLFDRLALTLPAWRERHAADIGVTLVELLAYTGDRLSYYQDAVAAEAYLATARQRISVRRHALLVDYRMHEGCNARAWVCLEAEGDEAYDLESGEVYFTTRPPEPWETLAHERAGARALQPSVYEQFEPMLPEPIHVVPANSCIRIYTWSGSLCCLPRGATAADLLDCDPADPSPAGRARRLRLRPGDFLAFEEVRSPATGREEDADHTHRHVVRLTASEPAYDPVEGCLLLRVRWSQRDALPFPLRLSSVGAPPDCRPIGDVSVARGNVVLVDHGRHLKASLGSVPVRETALVCAGPGRPNEEYELPGRYEPVLAVAPLVYAEPLAHGASAAEISVDRDPHQARPALQLHAVQVALEGRLVSHWLPQPDLLGSRPDDPHFVVETDNNGHAHIRFGDGQHGRAPEIGTHFKASYRVGGGPAGNVGAEAICLLMLRSASRPLGAIKVRNPLPARGGSEPETIEEVRRYAPNHFRGSRESAVTPEDYAAIVERLFPYEVQRAKAWITPAASMESQTVTVAIDAVGGGRPADLIRRISSALERRRQIGHRVEVSFARRVGVELELSYTLLPGHRDGEVRAALLERFSDRDLPGGGRGFFHPDTLSFGEPIYLSRIIAAALAIPGVADATVAQLRHAGAKADEQDDGALASGLLVIGPHEIAELANDWHVPSRGRLMLRREGGA